MNDRYKRHDAELLSYVTFGTTTRGLKPSFDTVNMFVKTYFKQLKILVLVLMIPLGNPYSYQVSKTHKMNIFQRQVT